jgi:hypothetical protein
MYHTMRASVRAKRNQKVSFDDAVTFRESSTFTDAARKLAHDEGTHLAVVLRGLLRDWVDAQSDAHGDGSVRAREGADGQASQK